MLETDYVHAELPKLPPPVPVRVSRQSQLRTALLRHESLIVIEDQDLARPFVRLLRTRDMKLRPLGAFVAEIASYASGGPTAPTLRRVGTSAVMSFRETFRK